MALEEQVVDAFCISFQGFVLKFCGVSLATLFTAWLLVVCGRRLALAIRKLSLFEKVLVVPTVACLFLYGGSKSGVFYDGGIRADGANENVITNDLVEVYWVKDTYTIPPVPDDATVYIDYRLKDTTNEWVNIGQSVVSNWYWSGTVVDATNYYYQVWAYYIPPEPVHTNGVWSYSTTRDLNDNEIIPLRADVEVDGRTIVEPIRIRLK